MQHALEARKLAIISSESEYACADLTELPEEKANDVMKLVGALEDDDDVQNVYTNLG
jgi:transcriptional/translational regulatory protein YebC/TACO1